MKKTFTMASILLIVSLLLSSCVDKGENTLTSFEGVWTLTKISINDMGDKLDITYDYTKPLLYSELDITGVITLKSLGDDKYVHDIFVYDTDEKLWYRYENGNVIIKDNKFMEEDFDEYFLTVKNITENSFTLEEIDEEYSFYASMTFKKLSGNPNDVSKFIKHTDAPNDY